MKLFLYLLLFLIGVFLYYIINNSNIEKLNISSQSLLFQSNPYKTMIQVQYNLKKKSKRLVHLINDKEEIKKMIENQTSRLRQIANKLLDVDDIPDLILIMDYVEIYTDYPDDMDDAAAPAPSWPFSINRYFGIGLKKIIGRRTRSCARPSTQYKFIFIGTPPNLLDEDTGLPVTDMILNISPEKYFVNMRDPSFQPTPIPVTASQSVSDLVADMFRGITDVPELRPPNGVEEGVPPSDTWTIFDETANAFNTGIALSPRLSNVDSRISEVAMLVADYSIAMIGIGLKRKKIYSPYNLWGLLESDDAISTTTNYTDVEDFNILDIHGAVRSWEWQDFGDGAMQAVPRTYGTHRISEGQKYLFHNGLLLKNAYGGSLITHEFIKQLEYDTRHFNQQKKDRVDNVLLALDMTNGGASGHVNIIETKGRHVCCFRERLLPSSRQTILCRYKYESHHANMENNNEYQIVYSPFKLTDIEELLHSAKPVISPYDMNGESKHFTVDTIPETILPPDKGVSYLEWLESNKDLSKNYATSEGRTPKIEYSTTTSESDKIVSEGQSRFYISEKSPEDINYVYGFLLCAVPELFKIADLEGVEMAQTHYGTGTGTGTDTPYSPEHSDLAALTIQRHTRGMLTRLRIGTDDDECSASLIQKLYIHGFIIEHCNDELNFYIE